LLKWWSLTYVQPCNSELAEALEIQLHYNVKKMGMINRYDVWVPHILTEKHLLTRVKMCVSFLARHKTHEKLISYNNVARKRSLSLPSESYQTVKKAGLHPKKTMLSIWWDGDGPK